MTWKGQAKNDAQLSEAYLAYLDKAEKDGTIDTLMDAEGDDSEGRITGEYRCGHCGVCSNDPDHPDTCCRPLFREAGL